MSADLLLVVELETLGLRVQALDRDLGTLASAESEYSQHFPQAGWIEHQPEEIWQATQRALMKVVDTVGADRIRGLALANHCGDLLIWNRATGKPIYPAIGGADRRSEPIVRVLRNNRREPMLHYRTGLFLDPTTCAAKIAWILDHVPEAREQARAGELAFGSMDSWILWQLTRGRLHATEPANASRTMLYDLNSHQWEPQLLATFGIPAVLLPRIMPSRGFIGEIDPSVLGISVPVLAMNCGHQAGFFALTAGDPAVGRVHYGKNLFLQQSIGSESLIRGEILTTLAWRRDHHATYCLEAQLPGSGVVVQWLKDALGLLTSYEECETLAAEVPDTAGVYLVPAFAGLAAPYFDPQARGTLLGLNFRTTRQHIARAALEGVAQLLADNLQTLSKASPHAIQRLRADGAGAGNNFLLQFQADITGLPIERPEHLDSGLVGIGLMAGISAGFWTEEEARHRFLTVGRVFQPHWSEEERRNHRERWQEAVARSREWARE
ncbi:MAG: FGGY family carbohydrate kinase [candidate division FCPU426 bacterium]